MTRTALTFAAALTAFAAVVARADVSTVSIFSPANNRDITFQVYTPPGYATNTSLRFPVVISLHGIGGESFRRADMYEPTLDARVNAGEILPMIWLFPDGQSNSFYGDAFDGHKQVYSHIIGEALPYVDANYRTIADRDQRAMEGFSMGGFGAAMLTAKHPELFSAMVEYGGALATWPNLVQYANEVATEMYNGVEAHFTPYSLWDQTDANAEALRTTVNYKMIAGDADSQYLGNTLFRDHLLALNIDPQFQVLPGVEHVADSYLAEGSGLRFLSAHFASKFQQGGDYDRDGEVNAGDYTAWRAAFGSNELLAADGNQNGAIDTGDYAVWRNHITAQVASLAGSATLPEPGAGLLALVACISSLARSKPMRRT